MILRGVCVLLLFAFLGLSGVVSAKDQVFLVAAKDCPIDTISTLELRKIYFGIPIRRSEIQIHGLRNLSDKRLDNIFLQTVVAMSKKSYQRRLLLLTLHHGRPRASKFFDTNTLIAELKKKICSVTYMWGHDVAQISEIKIIKLLWQAN